MPENLVLHASTNGSPGHRDPGNRRRHAAADRYMLTAPPGIPWGLFYAAARLPGPDPERGPGSRAAPHEYRKPAYNGPVFSCNRAVRP